MLFRKKQKETRSLLTTQDAELARLLGIEVDGISANKAKEATFFTCLRILSDTVSKLPLKLLRETSNGTEKASSHYLYQMLKLRPNRFMSSSSFWKAVEYQRNYHGHSVVVINTLPNGKIEGLYPLDMTKVQIWHDNAGILGLNNSILYVYTDGTKEYKFQAEEVLHFIGMTNNGISPMPVKDYLATTVENMQYGTQYVNKYFKGGLSASGILQYTGDLDDNGVNRMKDRFEKMANGLDNAGKILPVPVGFTFSALNASMADAQFAEISNMSIKAIAAAFGIKQHMLNDLNSAKFNNVTQQSDEFYRDTLQSILTMYEQEINWKLLTENERRKGHFFQFNVDAILRTDIKTRYEAYNIGLSGGFLTANEIREKEDLPLLDGGDQLIVNGTYQPLNKVGMAYEPVEETTEPKPEGGDLDE